MKKFFIVCAMLCAGFGTMSVSAQTIKDAVFYGTKAHNSLINPCSGKCVKICGKITYQDDGTQIVPYPGGISHDNNFGDFINTLSADGQQTTLKVTLKDADDNIIDERYVTYPGDKETVMEQITTEAVKNGATIE